MDPRIKHFPCIFSLRLPSGNDLVFIDGYPLRNDKTEQQMGIGGRLADGTVLPFVIVNNDMSKKDLSNPGFSKDMDRLMELVGKRFIEGRRNYFSAFLIFDNPDDKQFFTEFFHQIDKKKIDAEDFFKAGLESLPIAGPLLSKAYDWIRHRLDKENIEALEQVEKQRRIVYQFLFKSSRGISIFWKDREPTWHLLIDYDAFSKEELQSLSSLICQGVGDSTQLDVMIPRFQPKPQIMTENIKTDIL